MKNFISTSSIAIMVTAFSLPSQALPPQNSNAFESSFQTGAFSDHSLLTLSSKDGTLKVAQLNVAQLGRLKMFPAKDQFEWSSTLRTNTILRQLADKKADLQALGNKLKKIADGADDKGKPLSVQEKNEKIAGVAKTIIMPALQVLGFTVKSFTMEPYLVFNPGKKASVMKADPANFIQGPVYVLEDSQSYQTRMSAAYSAMFAGNPDVVTAQEIEFGESDGINFTSIVHSLAASHNYGFLAPSGSATAAIVFYNKAVFKDVHVSQVAELNNALKVFNDKVEKIQVLALEHLNNHQIYYAASIHADYNLANQAGPYSVLNKLLKGTPGLIVGGDFNAILANKSLVESAAQEVEGGYFVKETPELPSIGNPTYDAIFVAPGKK